jgi:uncharacterized protein YjlB
VDPSRRNLKGGGVPQSKTGAVETNVFHDDGCVPNSPLPVLLYRGAVAPSSHDPAKTLEMTFARNGWTNSWRAGIYLFHHYHSISHEVLGIARGKGRVRLGGEQGRDFDLAAGDVVVLPAGTGHKRLSASSDFLVVGAYPDGRDWDLIRADDSDAATHAAALVRISKVPRPSTDPIGGKDGALPRLWLP